MPRTPEKMASVWAQIGLYTSLAFILPAGAVGGYAVGWALDKWLRTSPVLAVVFTGLGAAGGIVEVLRILTRTEKRENSNRSNDRPREG